MDWQPVQGVPCLSLDDSCTALSWIKQEWKMDGWVERMFFGISQKQPLAFTQYSVEVFQTAFE